MKGWIHFTGIRFIGVGIVNTAVYFGLSSSLMGLVGVEVKIANAIAYSISMGVAYLGHRYVTFRSRGGMMSEGWRFAITHGFNLTISTILLYVLVNRLGTNRFAATAFATLVVMANSFVVMQLWVFRHRGAHGHASIVERGDA